MQDPQQLQPDGTTHHPAPFDRACPPSDAPPNDALQYLAPMARPTVRFMRSHPAHWIALGFGSGLSRIAPGTVGTLWAWVAFAVLSQWLGEFGWGVVIALSLPLGWWACTVTARNMRVVDPGHIVWDEIVAFWLVLWLVTPAGLLAQAVAFGLFRFFDAVKPGPVGWADRLFHHAPPSTPPSTSPLASPSSSPSSTPANTAATNAVAWHKAGFAILFDDLVAAFCTLLVIAVWRFA